MKIWKACKLYIAPTTCNTSKTYGWSGYDPVPWWWSTWTDLLESALWLQCTAVLGQWLGVQWAACNHGCLKQDLNPKQMRFVSTFFPQFKTDCWHPLSRLLTYGFNCLPLSYLQSWSRWWSLRKSGIKRTLESWYSFHDLRTSFVQSFVMTNEENTVPYRCMQFSWMRPKYWLSGMLSVVRYIWYEDWNFALSVV